MTRPGTALLLATLASCSPRSAGDPRPGDVALLAGPWEFVAHREGHPDLLGRVTLTPSAPDDPSIPRSLKGGTLELTGDRIVGHWVQEFSSHPAEGHFTMQRIGPDSAR